MADNTMVSRDYTSMYSGLLKSPWACSLEDEQKVSMLAGSEIFKYYLLTYFIVSVGRCCTGLQIRIRTFFGLSDPTLAM